jgi:hypothetical protein
LIKWPTQANKPEKMGECRRRCGTRYAMMTARRHRVAFVFRSATNALTQIDLKIGEASTICGASCVRK